MLFAFDLLSMMNGVVAEGGGVSLVEKVNRRIYWFLGQPKFSDNLHKAEAQECLNSISGAKSLGTTGRNLRKLITTIT